MHGNSVKSVVIKLLTLPLVGLVWLYQATISPFLGANCRHLPTCSEYAKDVVKLHGPLRGSLYALKRIGRCHPWAAPSFDPVPPAPRNKDKKPFVR